MKIGYIEIMFFLDICEKSAKEILKDVKEHFDIKIVTVYSFADWLKIDVSHVKEDLRIYDKLMEEHKERMKECKKVIREYKKKCEKV